MDDPTTSGTEGFGLMFYNARWYDPYIGRFAQADSIIPLESQGTQAWDRYAGMNNNPVRYSDPSGHRACDDDETCDGNGNKIPVAKSPKKTASPNLGDTNAKNKNESESLQSPTQTQDDCVLDPGCFYASQSDIIALSNFFGYLAVFDGVVGAIALSIGIAGTVTVTAGGITVVLAPGPLIIGALGVLLVAESFDAASLSSHFETMASGMSTNENIAIRREETLLATYYQAEGATVQHGTSALINRGYMWLSAWVFSWDD